VINAELGRYISSTGTGLSAGLTFDRSNVSSLRMRGQARLIEMLENNDALFVRVARGGVRGVLMSMCTRSRVDLEGHMRMSPFPHEQVIMVLR
jgi:hypothetical protein